MTSGWAEVCSGLAALLRHASPAAPGPAADVTKWKSLIELLGSLKAVQPTPAEKAEVSRLVRSLARLLASWDEELQRQLRASGPGPVMLTTTGIKELANCCSVIGGATTVAEVLGASRADALEVCQAAQLVQGSGRLAVELLTATAHSLPTGANTQLARDLLASSVASQLAAMACLLTLANTVGVVGEFAEQAAPASALLPWLQAILAALQAVPQAATMAYTGLPHGLEFIACAICNAPGFERHRLQLQADHALSANLVGLLFRGLDRAAVNLSLPHDRQPGGGLDLSWVTGIVPTLASPTLAPELERHAAAAADGSLLRMLRNAAAVLHRLPAPASTSELCTHSDAASLVAAITQQIRNRSIQDQAAVTLLPLLSSLTSTLQLGARLGFASGGLPSGWGPHLQNWACIVLTAAGPVAGKPVELPGGAASAPAWCAAAAEACRLLPLLADAAPYAAGHPSAEHPAVHFLATGVLKVAETAAFAALQHTQHGSGPSAEPGHPATLLFEAACRAVHWAAAQPAGVAELLPGEEQPLLHVLFLLCKSFGAVVQVQLQGSGATQGLDAAFLTAVQAAVRAPHCKNAILQSLPTCISLARVLAAGLAEFSLPPAAWSPSLPGVLGELLRALPPGEESTAQSWTFVLRAARDAPLLAAWLLAGQGQAALLKALPAARQSEGLRSSMLGSFSNAVTGMLGEAEIAQREAETSGTPQSSRAQLQQDSRQVAAALQELQATGRFDGFFARVGSACGRLAEALQARWQGQDAAPERQQAAQLELAKAAVTRSSCAHLACPNLEATGRRGKLCSGCRVARYCCQACSLADWRAGHRAACRLLAAARAAGDAAGQPQRQTRAAGAGP